MFAIVISEKGGAERRELFEKHEIHVGRMQGNDLMLPKGNVSKRHARLMFRDGRVIVTDLKSTNGTYVNGRKIAQATILGEGDRIYVGDFVLRVELTSTSNNPAAPRSTTTGAGTGPSSSQNAGLSASRPAFNSEADFTGRQEAFHMPYPEKPQELSSGTAHPDTVAPAAESPRDTGPLARQPGGSLAPRAGNEPGVHHDEARAHALRQLLDAVALVTDLSWLSAGHDPDQARAEGLRQIVREEAKRLGEQHRLGAEIELEQVVGDALRELLGLGPIDLLLDDQDVTEIRAFGPHHVTAIKGDDVSIAGPSFSTENALRQIILRLCERSQRPLTSGETVVERRLSTGLVIHAVLAPTSDRGPALVVKRQRRAQAGLEDLVRSGMISRAMATLLYGCVSLRTNLLLVGPAEATATLLSALIAVGTGHTRAIVLQQDDEVWKLEPSPLLMPMHDTGTEGATLVRAAAKLHPERLVVTPMLGQVAAAVVAAVGHGARGVLATVPAPSSRHALQRLSADLMIALPGITPQAASASLLGSFEVAVEIARLRDGRHRVTRLAELAMIDGELAPRDVFTFVVERTAAGGAIEGSFTPTGVVPKMIEDLALQGSPFDSAVFRRER